MKKIGIDVRMMGLENAGIGRYIANLVREIKNEKLKIKNWRLYLFVKNKTQISSSTEQLNNLTIIEVRARHYSLKEQFLIPWIVWQSKLDLVHFPHFNVPIFCPVPFVVTIHDLIKHKSRGFSTTTRFPLIYWLKYAVYLLVFGLAVKRAKKIIVPSEAVKKELIKRYKLSPDKVIVTYEGVGNKFQISNDKLQIEIPNLKLLKKYKIKKPFIIYTGSLYPHKNIERLIKAVKSLKLELVICCSRSVFLERMKKKIKGMKAEKLVKLPGFVSDEELVRLYREAIAFVQPSLMEGFDLTVIEAMAVGLSVVISDIPVHREIAGLAAVYFDPEEVEDMIEKIKTVIESKKLRNSLIEKGLERSKRYRWRQTAQETLKIYESCFGL